MGVTDYVLLGIESVFGGPEMYSMFGLPFSQALVMVFAGFLFGIVVGSTPGLAGPMAMAISLPILISVFGYTKEALLPVMGFLIGIMKGATVGGAVPAILFNTPGTPDAYMTTMDGYPMAKKGEAAKALRISHFSSASGDTFSDVVLIICAPFLAVVVERYLDLPEKTALLILSMAFIAAVVGGSPAKGLISTALGLLAATIGTGEDFSPRLTMDYQGLASGFPVVAPVLGVLILGEVFRSMEDLWMEAGRDSAQHPNVEQKKGHLSKSLIKRIFPYVVRSAFIGTAIGALPGIGSTLAATLGYTSGRLHHHKKKNPDDVAFGEGAPEGIAATEAANSSVSGANLIPVLSLGIPGNAAAVFLILAADSIGGFNPGPSVFRFTADEVNPELVVAFGLFVMMMVANLMNWTIGGVFMRSMGIMAKIPKRKLLPVILLLTLTAVYIQETKLAAVWMTVGFGFLGYFMRRLAISPLPFIIAFILGGRLEDTARQAFSATGGDPWFLFSSATSIVFLFIAVLTILVLTIKGNNHHDPA